MDPIVRERWAVTHLPAIIFRDGPGGRRAGLRSGPDVWEILMVARDYGDDREGLLAHFGGTIPAAEMEQALTYASLFRAEIDGMIAGNEEAARRL